MSALDSMALATWSAPPWPACVSMRSSAGAAGSAVLHRRDELARVHRVDPVVVVGRHHQQRRVLHAAARTWW